jgi:hypothetical protein
MAELDGSSPSRGQRRPLAAVHDRLRAALDRAFGTEPDGNEDEDDGEGEEDGNGEGEGAAPGDPLDRLAEWNRDVEELIRASPAFDSNNDDDENDEEVGAATAALADQFVACARHALLFDRGISDSEEEQEQEPGGRRRTRRTGGGPVGDADSASRSVQERASRLLSALRSRGSADVGEARRGDDDDSRGTCAGTPDARGVPGRRVRKLGAATSSFRSLAAVVQASKNWLRYLLVHRSASESLSMPAGANAGDAAGGYLRDQRREFQSLPMLKLYFHLLDRFLLDDAANPQPMARPSEDLVRDNTQPFDANECARCTSLLLFYATFDAGLSTTTRDPPSHAHRAVVALIRPDSRGDDDDLGDDAGGAFRRLLRYLLNARTSAVAVTLARNVHQFLAVARDRIGGDRAVQLWEATALPSGPARCVAPWAAAAAMWDPAHFDRQRLPVAPPSNVSPRTTAAACTYEATLVEILLWCSDACNDESASAPAGASNRDRRSELALEVLRILYIVRFGRNLQGPADGASPTMDAGIPDRARTLQWRTNAILRLLELEAGVVDADPLWWECQRAAIALLMDADPSFASVVVSHPVALDALLRALDRLVSETVAAADTGVAGGRQYADPSAAAAAALTPVLAVLHKFCQADAECRCAAQRFVFPPRDSEEPDRPAEEVKEVEPRARASPSSAGKKMKPLDAPKGSLRAKMIRLLTWPQSHIKRFAGELLWVLCDQDSAKFVRTVGMGNAIAILGSKGVIDLPSQIFE